MTPKKKPFAKTKKDVQLVKDLLYPLLQHEILDVEFRKVDGTVRKMQCTRNYDDHRVKIAFSDVDKELQRKKNPDICRVWDVEKQAWRSFRFDSMISVAVV